MPDDPQRDPVSTDELIKRIGQIQSGLHEQARSRHELNGRLMSWINLQEQHIEESNGNLGRTLTQIRAINDQVVLLDKQVQGMQKQVTELDHILRGVDGSEGMRSDLKEIRGRIRYLELRVFGLCALVGGSSFILSKLGQL